MDATIDQTREEKKTAYDSESIAKMHAKCSYFNLIRNNQVQFNFTFIY